jgi:toxin YoeB
MTLIFSHHAWNDYLHWQRTDRKTHRRVNELIRDIQRNGNEGIGKPELLRHGLSGYWSRRFTSEHRLVYKIQGKDLLLVQLRYHY